MLRKKWMDGWMEEVECRAHRLKLLDTVLKRDRYFTGMSITFSRCFFVENALGEFVLFFHSCFEFYEYGE